VRPSQPRVENSPIPDEVKANWTDPRKEDAQRPCHPATDGRGKRPGGEQKRAANHRNENKERHGHNKESEPCPEAFSAALQYRIIAQANDAIAAQSECSCNDKEVAHVLYV